MRGLPLPWTCEGGGASLGPVSAPTAEPPLDVYARRRDLRRAAVARLARVDAARLRGAPGGVRGGDRDRGARLQRRRLGPLAARARRGLRGADGLPRPRHPQARAAERAVRLYEEGIARVEDRAPPGDGRSRRFGDEAPPLRGRSGSLRRGLAVRAAVDRADVDGRRDPGRLAEGPGPAGRRAIDASRRSSSSRRGWI